MEVRQLDRAREKTQRARNVGAAGLLMPGAQPARLHDLAAGHGRPGGLRGLHAQQGLRCAQRGPLQEAPHPVPGPRRRLGRAHAHPADARRAGVQAHPDPHRGHARHPAAGRVGRHLPRRHGVRAAPDPRVHGLQQVQHHGREPGLQHRPHARGQEQQERLRTPALLALVHLPLVRRQDRVHHPVLHQAVDRGHPGLAPAQGLHGLVRALPHGERVAGPADGVPVPEGQGLCHRQHRPVPDPVRRPAGPEAA